MFKEVLTTKRFPRYSRLFLPFLFRRYSDIGYAFMLKDAGLSFISAKIEGGRFLIKSFEEFSDKTETAPKLIKKVISNYIKSPIECVVVIPEEEVVYKVVSAKNEEDPQNAILSSILELFFSPKDFLYHYDKIQPIKPDISHSDYSVWVVTREYLEKCKKIFEEAGVYIKDIIPENLATIEMVFPQKETPDANLIINVSRTRITFLIFAGRAIYFSGVLPFGSSNIFNGSGNEEKFIFEILQILDFYKNRVFHEHGASSVINRILLVGDIPKELISRISANTQIHIETSEIWNVISGDTPKISEIIQARDASIIPLLGAIKFR
jgi:hypothetical protein